MRLLTLAAPALALAKSQRQRPLTFSEDGTFQIAIFEDLHYGEGEAHIPDQCCNFSSFLVRC